VLARRKAQAVADRLTPKEGLVVACDSLLEFEGESWGKAASSEEVVHRWKRLRGATGLLHTGHAVIDAASERQAAHVDAAVVHFGEPTDREIEAYSRTPESLQVAGPFTLEGRSAPWIESIEGNYGTITGISLAVLRRLLARLDVEIVDLWS
jgi:septum formation protein